jgi:anthranilate synthase component 1
MKITSFEEFKDLARRGTFVPVCKEIVADLLTPVSAFLKIAEHADYAFLLESVEGGEHVARYSFLGKDPFLILRAARGVNGAAGRTTIERGGEVTDSDAPFIETLRRLMADFRSPYVPELPRFTGGAVGYLGYDAASWFEPVLGDLGESADGSDRAGFMLFDTAPPSITCNTGF